LYQSVYFEKHTALRLKRKMWENASQDQRVLCSFFVCVQANASRCAEFFFIEALFFGQDQMHEVIFDLKN
jgi:hypothetical protein